MIYPASRPYIWMLFGSFSFTLMAEIAHVLIQGSSREWAILPPSCDWPTAAVARGLLVAIFAGVLAILGGAKLVFIGPLRLWVRSIAGSCSMVCTFYAFGTLPSSSDVLTLTNTFPLWVALISWPLYKRAPDTKVWLAIAAGVIGVALVEQPHLASGNIGALAALVAAVLTAVAMLGLSSLNHIDPRAVVVHFSMVATVFCTATALVSPHTQPIGRLLEISPLLLLLGLGLTATTGQIFLTLAFANGAPAKVSVVGLTQIVFALAIDTFLWGREVNALTLAGTLLVITPTAWLLTRTVSVKREQLIVPHSVAPAREPRSGETRLERQTSEPLSLRP